MLPTIAPVTRNNGAITASRSVLATPSRTSAGASPRPPASRLEQLLRLRDQLETEIRRERAYLARSATIAAGLDAVLSGYRDPHVALADLALLLDVPVEDLVGDRRPRRLILRRHIAAWVLRQEGFSFPDIGRALHRDHSTARYSVCKVDDDPQLRAIASQTHAALRRPTR